MKDKISGLFQSEKGKRISEDIFRAMSDYKMSGMLEKGVLVGFSGGADSVMLLSFLVEHSLSLGNFPIVAVHVNHGIRGAEAERDEEFARSFCHSINVEFVSCRVDVPAIAEETKMGLEECARKCRYSEFFKIIEGRSDISTICVAHNADDNLETVILNMLRGCGTKGMAGIPPVRNNIVRPLLYLTKGQIVSALAEHEIPFVVDSTNLSNDYKRNFIRNNILPSLRKISDSPEIMAARASRNLRCDDEYLTFAAERFLEAHEGVIKNSDLLDLHDAVFSRVLCIMSSCPLSSVNVFDVRRLLSNENFSYSLPEGKTFLCEYGICRVIDSLDFGELDYTRKLVVGVNRFDDFDADVILSDQRSKCFANVYKFSIQASLSSAIIEGDLYLRPKKDGDSIRYGGMTRKLKKLFNDRKIPPSLRNLIPIICDDRGVVFVPGFGVRDDGVGESEQNSLFVSLCIGKGDSLKKKRFYSGNEDYK